MTRSLILGIGNVLLSDDGAGVHALRCLATQHPELDDVTLLDGGTLSFTLEENLAGAENLIVLDAAQLGEPPGTIRILIGSEMDEFLSSGRRSVHEVGLADLLDICRLTGQLPEHRALIGIQPESVDWGELPTASVQLALSSAAEAALALLGRWTRLSQVSAGSTKHARSRARLGA